MTTSNVDSEISQYIKDHGICTTFGIFVTDNEDNLIEWSSSLAIANASQLFNYWFGKFKSTYQQCFDNPKRLKAPKLNPLIWNEVLNGSMSKKRLRTSFEDGVSNLLVATGNSIIAREMDRLAPACTSTSASDGPEPPSASVGSESPASGPPSSSTSTSPLELEYCDKRYHLFELMPEFDVLTPFVVKKSRYTLKDVDKEVLRKLSRKNDSVSERMLNEIIRVLLQDGWSDVERHTVKLLLSRVVNLMDPDMLQNTQDILTPYQFHVASKLADDIKNSTLVLDLVSSTTLDTLIDTSASLHDFRLNVKKESLKILDSWDINTDCNQMLTVLDIIGAYLNNKKLDEEASELTMYRRFAFILDFLFDDPEMKLTDGEIVSDATRMAMEQNNYEHAATFGRRIDLLMKVQGTDDPLELAFKRMEVQENRPPSKKTAKQKHQDELRNSQQVVCNKQWKNKKDDGDGLCWIPWLPLPITNYKGFLCC
ncbi:unnamed protein product [Absidia cylindrospora]